MQQVYHCHLSGPERRVLNSLAWWESIGVETPDKQNVAIVAGYTNTRSKGFANALGSLRSGGLINHLRLTPAGRGQSEVEGPSSLAELHQRVLAELPPTHQKLLRDVLNLGRISREDLAARNGYTNLRSKGFSNALGRLRSMGFVGYDGADVVATALLFPPGLR